MTTAPVGFLRDLPAGRAMRTEVDSHDLVVWRTADGEINVWNNRCPHRGMRLSHGFVRGDRLACLYHGWQFGAGGQCKYIPAHPDLDPPTTIRAESFSVEEQGGVIWVSTESGTEVPASEPDMEPVRSMIIEAGEAIITSAALKQSFRGAEPVKEKGGLLQLADRRIGLLLNPISASQTQIHVLIDKAADMEDRKAVSRWCEAVRRSAEAEEPQQ